MIELKTTVSRKLSNSRYCFSFFRFKPQITVNATDVEGYGRRLRRNMAQVRRHIDCVASVLNYLEVFNLTFSLVYILCFYTHVPTHLSTEICYVIIARLKMSYIIILKHHPNGKKVDSVRRLICLLKVLLAVLKNQ